MVQHMSTNLCLSQNNIKQQRNSLRKQLEIFSEVKRAQESNYDDYHSNKKTDYLSESAAERESPQYQLRMRILLGRVVLDLRSKFKYNEHESLTVVN